MKTYTPVYFATGQDMLMNTRYAIDSAQGKASQQLIDLGFDQNVSEQLYYAPINKFYIMLAWSFTLYLGAGMPAALDWTTDRETALNWSVDSPPGGEWRSYTDDQQWQTNVKVAKENLDAHAKAYSTKRIALTFAQVLYSIYYTLKTRGFFTLASRAFQLLQIWQKAGSFTPKQQTAYENLLDDCKRLANL